MLRKERVLRRMGTSSCSSAKSVGGVEEIASFGGVEDGSAEAKKIRMRPRHGKAMAKQMQSNGKATAKRRQNPGGHNKSSVTDHKLLMYVLLPLTQSTAQPNSSMIQND